MKKIETKIDANKYSEITIATDLTTRLKFYI